jgi:hypothetical protein
VVASGATFAIKVVGVGAFSCGGSGQRKDHCNRLSEAEINKVQSRISMAGHGFGSYSFANMETSFAELNAFA